jgi:hypothetical protein
MAKRRKKQKEPMQLPPEVLALRRPAYFALALLALVGGLLIIWQGVEAWQSGRAGPQLEALRATLSETISDDLSARMRRIERATNDPYLRADLAAGALDSAKERAVRVWNDAPSLAAFSPKLDEVFEQDLGQFGYSRVQSTRTGIFRAYDIRGVVGGTMTLRPRCAAILSAAGLIGQRHRLAGDARVKGSAPTTSWSAATAWAPVQGLPRRGGRDGRLSGLIDRRPARGRPRRHRHRHGADAGGLLRRLPPAHRLLRRGHRQPQPAGLQRLQDRGRRRDPVGDAITDLYARIAEDRLHEAPARRPAAARHRRRLRQRIAATCSWSGRCGGGRLPATASPA